MSWALVTNDDGISAPGLHALAGAAVAAGHRVVVAAPAEQASGAGASVITTSRDGGVPITAHELPGLAGVPAWAVAGAPAFIVVAAFEGWFDEPPALVLSGINEGANCGRPVLHSGTVGAALSVVTFGARALAVSLDCDGSPPGQPRYWDSAAGLVPEVLELLAGTPPGTVLNLNVPDRPAAELGPVRPASLAARGRLRAVAQDRRDGHIEIRILSDGLSADPGTDVALLAEGHPTLTALRSVDEDPAVSLEPAT